MSSMCVQNLSYKVETTRRRELVKMRCGGNDYEVHGPKSNSLF